MKNIQNIIFDLGGVLLNIDFHKTVAAFEQFGLIHFETWINQAEQQKLSHDFETGKIDKKAFIKTFNDRCGKDLSENDFITNWNAMLLNFPLQRLQLLQQLRLHYNLFLLSNTNEIHEVCFNQKIKRQTGFPNINIFFDRAYFSHRMGIRKPDPKAFQAVLSENNLLPKQTLFIDDSEENTKAAVALDIQTVLLKNGMTIEKDIFKPLK